MSSSAISSTSSSSSHSSPIISFSSPTRETITAKTDLAAQGFFQRHSWLTSLAVGATATALSVPSLGFLGASVIGIGAVALSKFAISKFYGSTTSISPSTSSSSPSHLSAKKTIITWDSLKNSSSTPFRLKYNNPESGAHSEVFCDNAEEAFKIINSQEGLTQAKAQKYKQFLWTIVLKQKFDTYPDLQVLLRYTSMNDLQRLANNDYDLLRVLTDLKETYATPSHLFPMATPSAYLTQYLSANPPSSSSSASASSAYLKLSSSSANHSQYVTSQSSASTSASSSSAVNFQLQQSYTPKMCLRCHQYPARVETRGSVQIQHDYCGRTCAIAAGALKNASSSSAASSQLQQSHTPKMCLRQGCQRPAYFDRIANRQHDYCSQTCAIAAGQLQRKY